MMLAQDGRRAGTVSGGCLEADVARRAWWLTESGPVVERYSTLEDDGDLPYGSGCGGVVFILLERRKTASPLLHALKAAFDARMQMAIAVVLEGIHIGRRAFAGVPEAGTASLQSEGVDGAFEIAMRAVAEDALNHRISGDHKTLIDGELVRVWADYRAARPGLWIFGAGDDAKPLVRLARELGWFVAVADGRSQLATQGRFASADVIRLLPIGDLPDATGEHLNLLPSDAAVLMTHSYEQDTHILAALLRDGDGFSYAYVGVLGPQRRTREALAEAARLVNRSADVEQIEEWLAQLHAPTGIDLGADTPASIALSILAEIQQTLSAATALPLSQVRATPVQVGHK
jgi:xanthine/CO dehydrogenase XdhC/CoxF family maturation factor